MKLTPTVVVQIGALIGAIGTLLLARMDLSPHEADFLRGVALVILGLFFTQIGYAQSLREKPEADAQMHPKHRDNPE
jgi:hypothetical protein